MANIHRTVPRFSQGISMYLIFLCLIFVFVPVWAHAGATRFFLSGDGTIHIRNVHSGKEAKITLLSSDGSLNEDGLNQADELFGFPTKEKGEHISPRLLLMVDYFADHVAPGKRIDMNSGYRSPEYNNAIRNSGANAAPTSLHMDGMALDFSIEGVNGNELWKTIKDKDCCGVGHYGGNSIHLDSGRPRFWEAATSKVRSGESDKNRRIYLTTDFDRYRPGDAVRLSFASISDFGFGIKREITLINEDSEKNNAVAVAKLGASSDDDCLMLNDRPASRLISVTLPPGMKKGAYRVRTDFCRRPFDEMPVNTLSNRIELSD